MKAVPLKSFSSDEQATWRQLFNRQRPLRYRQIVPTFSAGLELLQIGPERIPDLNQVNERLMNLTGWQGIPVEGLEDGPSFYSMLSQRKFPVGNFIRDPKDLSYTPAPDIFHDLYGHLPFYTDPAYAEFCEEYGKQALRFRDDPVILREFERFFWFTVEFGLLETDQGRRIFGAGIASSYGECEYALSDRPEVVPFDVEQIRQQEFRIDIFQKKLFSLKSPDQLYQSLDDFVAAYQGKGEG